MQFPLWLVKAVDDDDDTDGAVLVSNMEIFLRENIKQENMATENKLCICFVI